VQFVLSATEHLIGRTVRSVLDVGCGEARWMPLLRALRPRMSYTGVDASEYVVRRFGRSRHIVHGRLGELDSLGLDDPFDLVICSDVLHYLSAAEVASAARELRTRMRGVGFFELFTSADDFDGDRKEWRRRSARWYRRTFRAAGLIPCGMHLYAAPAARDALSALERCD
jgi:SAM-dependent methyltransferase